MIPFHRDGTDLVAELDDFEVALVTSLVAQVNELIGGAGEPAASDDPFARWARELRARPETQAYADAVRARYAKS